MPAPKQSAPKQVSFSIKVREDSILKEPVFVNQFRVHTADDVVHLFVNFNYSGQNFFSGLLVINESTVAVNKESIAPYYEKLLNSNPQGAPAEEAGFTASTPNVFHGNFLEFSHYGPLAQIRLIYFSIWHLAVADKSHPTEVPAQVSCVLNMPLSVQLGIVRKIYFAS